VTWDRIVIYVLSSCARGRVRMRALTVGTGVVLFEFLLELLPDVLLRPTNTHQTH